MIMDEVIPEERAPRDFRAKFPDDVLQENLAGQLWFGAEVSALKKKKLSSQFKNITLWQSVFCNSAKKWQSFQLILPTIFLSLVPLCWVKHLKSRVGICFDASLGQSPNEKFGEREKSFEGAMFPKSSRIYGKDLRIFENFGPSFCRVWTLVRLRHGPCQIRDRVWSPTGNHSFILGNSTKVLLFLFKYHITLFALKRVATFRVTRLIKIWLSFP